jgi:hypothetical protein
VLVTSVLLVVHAPPLAPRAPMVCCVRRARRRLAVAPSEERSLRGGAVVAERAEAGSERRRAVAVRPRVGSHSVAAQRVLGTLPGVIGNQAMQRVVAGLPPASPVVQRTFSGTYGKVLSMLTPKALGAADNFYAGLWNELTSSPVAVAVEPGANSYDQGKKKLNLNESMLIALSGHITGKKLPKTELGSHIAAITHELSHAHDHVVKARAIRATKDAGLNEHTKDVIDTELRAWAREALSAHQSSPDGLSVDKEKAILIEGWRGATTAMLDDLKAAKNENYVMERLWNYLVRELQPSAHAEVQAWVNAYKDWLIERIGTLQKAIPAATT